MGHYKDALEVIKARRAGVIQIPFTVYNVPVVFNTLAAYEEYINIQYSMSMYDAPAI